MWQLSNGFIVFVNVLADTAKRLSHLLLSQAGVFAGLFGPRDEDFLILGNWLFHVCRIVPRNRIPITGRFVLAIKDAPSYNAS